MKSSTFELDLTVSRYTDPSRVAVQALRSNIVEVEVEVVVVVTAQSYPGF